MRLFTELSLAECRRKRSAARVLVLLVMLLPALFPAGASSVYSPADVPNVQLADASRFVSDPEHLLSSADLAAADSKLAEIRRATSAEGVAIIVPSIGDLTPTEFCEKIFTSWGIGKRDKDNGFILLIAPDDRQAWIQTGYGLEGALPDALCSSILRDNVVPAMKKGDTGTALNSALSAIGSVLTDPSVRDEILSSQREGASSAQVNTLSADVFWDFVGIVIAIVFVGGFVMFCLTLRRAKGKSRYEQALIWKGARKGMIAALILSCGTAVVYALPALLIYKRKRNGTHKCSCCGAKMKKLSEEEDNTKLTPSQDLEERLDTVDYDVWVCPDCGAVDRYAFKKDQKKYTECPNCGAIANRLIEDLTVVPATTRQTGTGEKVYECANCHHRTHRRYGIPRKPDVSDAAVAGAILGSMAGRGRGNGGGGFGGGFGGGGFGGGGFGGGSTGGGGGGASW